MKRTLLLIILSVWLFSVFSIRKNYSFERINVENGLSQSWVIAIAQDSLGFMWIGTSDGLNKYDGYNFSIFKNNPSDPSSLVNNHVQALEIDERGRLWVGTGSGLCYFNGLNNSFVNSDSFTSSSVNTLLCKDGRMYVGTFDGLFIYDISNDSLLSRKSSKITSALKNPNVYSLEPRGSGEIWVGTDEGLYIYYPEKEIIEPRNWFDNKDIFSKQRIRTIEFDSRNQMWFGTEEEGLFLVPEIKEDGHSEIFQFKHNEKNVNSIAAGSIIDLTEDRQGNLWIGSENGGLDLIKLGTFNKKRPRFIHNKFDASRNNSISNNSIHSLFEDFRGDLWIGTYGDGINFLNSDGENFSLINHVPREHESLVNNFVNAIKKYNDELWVGTEGGITVLNLASNKYRHYSHRLNDARSLSIDAVMSLYKDSDDDMWIGTWAGGLNKLHKGSNHFQHYQHDLDKPESIEADNIFNMVEDKKGNVWMAVMDGGLNYYSERSNSFGKYLKGDGSGLPSNWIRDVLISRKGRIWYSSDICVGYLVDDKFVNFYPDKKDTTTIGGNGAFVIFEDSKGTIWFGTDAGLSYFDEKTETFQSYDEMDGLPNNSVKSILEDGHNNLWLGTNKGLSKFVGGVDKPSVPSFINYDSNDGLQGNEFNRRAAFRDEDGYMYFGGPNGISYFHPDRITRNMVAPKMVFTNFEVYNKQVQIDEEGSPLKKHISHTKSIVLNHHQSVFTIEFAALNYLGKQKNQYAYMLKGFESRWNHVGSQRSATFTNLDAGDYVFMVKGSNNDNVWNETPLELKIKVLPPWYRSNLALITYILVLMLSIYLFIWVSMSRLRGKQNLLMEREHRIKMEELNKTKLQFFTNISHEFRTPLTLIYSPLEDILRNQHDKLPSELKRKFSIIYKNALRLNRLIGELMDFRKIQFSKLTPTVYNQDLNRFVETTANLFSEEAKDNNIQISVSLVEDDVRTWFDPGMLEKVLFNLISNAFKVTPEYGSIIIDVFKTSDVPEESEEATAPWTCIRVKDTGPGLEKGELDKIFDRFYQADAQTKSYYSSTGIGLSLALSMMQLHNGYITVKSKPGEGAEFTVWLRNGKRHFKSEQLKEGDFYLREQLKPEESQVLSNEGEINTDIQKYTVLVVEDNTELRKYLKSELSRTFKVLLAKNGQEGVDVASQHFPDIIVSDVIMPEKDGYQLCEEVKNNARLSHIPVILLTAKGAVEDQIKGIDTGADEYMVKPFNINLLKAKIKNLISSREQLIKKYSGDINLISEETSITSVDRNFLKEFHQYIFDHIEDSELSVEQISHQLAISRSQLYRKIKAFSGVSVNEFIRNMRLEAARRLIISKQYSINEVVYKVGFSSPSYFSKCYKEHFGKLPSEE